jgi:hypothetical protein
MTPNNVLQKIFDEQIIQIGMNFAEGKIKSLNGVLKVAI